LEAGPAVIAGLLARLGASRWACAVLRCGLIVTAIVLFLLSIRRAAERTGRLLERLDAMEKTNEVQREMLEAAARRPRNRGELARRLRDGRF
jgi:hypothetical protein